MNFDADKNEDIIRFLYKFILALLFKTENLCSRNHRKISKTDESHIVTYLPSRSSSIISSDR